MVQTAAPFLDVFVTTGRRPRYLAGQSPLHGRLKARIAVAAAALMTFGTAFLENQAARADSVKHVLVLYENNRLLPANIEADRGLNEVVRGASAAVEIRAEFLDYPEFGGDDYAQTVTTFLRDKYRMRPPDVVVAGGEGALEFLLTRRKDLFGSAPVVYMGVDQQFLSHLTLPGDVYGIPVRYEAVKTVAQALQWHPQATRLVTITGTSPDDRRWEARLHVELAQFQGRVSSIDHLSGRTTAALRQEVSALGKDSIIFTPGYFKDGAGESFAPRQAAEGIASTTSAPVYGPYNTFIGTGVVGGFVPTFLSMGQVTGQIVNQLLAGRPVSELDLPPTMPTALSVDWRQIERWNIDPKKIPADAVVQFKVLGFWDLYRTPALVGLAILVLQSGLVIGLLLERRRRRRAEGSVDRHRFELAHAARLAVAGELTASIAHEINQPLGAIENNVAAATMILKDEKHSNELRLILDDIRRDNIRASEVIRQLRKLMEKHEVERKIVNLNDAIADMQIVLRGEAQRRRVELTGRQHGKSIEIMGDRIQIMQVLINLVLNAMDAVADEEESRRTVTVAVSVDGANGVIDVRDSGHGIGSEHRSQLFDSFFSTKPGGIGLGLSIVRTLVESHGGSVWAADQPEGGAVFRVTLPLANRQIMEAA